VTTDLTAAHAAVDEAVAILREGRARPHERITKAAKDFLTDVDLASESAMRRSLAASTPEIGFYGEAGG
jgi:myo-inositol-1(or 4)-monophosphatase